MADLLDQIEWPSVECLNQHPSHNIGNALKQVRHAGMAPYIGGVLLR